MFWYADAGVVGDGDADADVDADVDGDADGDVDGYVGCDVDGDAEANERSEASLKLWRVTGTFDALCCWSFRSCSTFLSMGTYGLAD